MAACCGATPALPPPRPGRTSGCWEDGGGDRGGGAPGVRVGAGHGRLWENHLRAATGGPSARAVLPAVRDQPGPRRARPALPRQHRAGPLIIQLDIRDTVKYKEVMKQYGLGPNGGIVTSLNLFATRFDQVMKFIEKRQNASKYVIIDTPGQIEVFTWSASGTIITEALASSFPSVVVYVMDTSRSTNPITFMSNMLYACREYRPEYERLRKTLEKAQNKQKREQLEHLWKDMGSVCMQGNTLAGSDDASAMGPSELILTRGTLDEEEERESDTDDIDHEVTEESHEEPAFRNFMQEARMKYQRRNNPNEQDLQK
ncbi:PREDICTED: GPN-loop GTPase 1 isoform X3 [Calidris pugnax]|uniref:GPN-loop GTPase 1 isoform X3 n=1 Tax=Calidris pugnax TaxID=198806 RepID=UPI00071E26D7|nr:PREDICTED: GPN-loop GTPase 1 isoform X3 [Calidris pugnax]